MKQGKTIVINAAGSLDVAARAIEDGGIVVYPTETFYGLAVNPFNKTAVGKLFELKGRDSKNPVSILVRDELMLITVTSELTPLSMKLMKKFWPGPLTLVLKASKDIPVEITASTGTIGVRMSPLDTVKELLKFLHCPITATSANPSGKPPAKSAKEALAYFDGLVDVIIDGGLSNAKEPSTVADATGEKPVVLRPGAIPEADLHKP